MEGRVEWRGEGKSKWDEMKKVEMVAVPLLERKQRHQRWYELIGSMETNSTLRKPIFNSCNDREAPSQKTAIAGHIWKTEIEMVMLACSTRAFKIFDFQPSHIDEVI
ncbi:unnamed protein product [Sphenostylis stenocarpa]|uniref:Uncharacterized protein n=1 Tax=Sphenostylis stenocarpa TaxID=92480 RepID=A0AA86S6E5_9FABA|nr:unnamed protein product [Sphenostylis stenocarpa]